MTKQMTENSISDTDFEQLWSDLTHNQQRFAVALLEFKTKREAAVAIGIKPDTAYHWNGEVDAAVEYMKRKARESATTIITKSLVKAASIKRAGLDSGDEKLRQDVSSEILDRGLGKAKMAVEHTGKDGGPIQTNVSIYIPDNERD